MVGSSESLPFKDNSFDIVRSNYVVEHCLKVEQMIREHLRVCRKKVVIVTDNNEWVGDIYHRLVGTGRIFNKQHCYAWTKEYMINLLERMKIKKYKVELRNMSPRLITRIVSKFAFTEKLKHFFLREIVVEITKV